MKRISAKKLNPAEDWKVIALEFTESGETGTFFRLAALKADESMLLRLDGAGDLQMSLMLPKFRKKGLTFAGSSTMPAAGRQFFRSLRLSGFSVAEIPQKAIDAARVSDPDLTGAEAAALAAAAPETAAACNPLSAEEKELFLLTSRFAFLEKAASEHKRKLHELSEIFSLPEEKKGDLEAVIGALRAASSQFPKGSLQKMEEVLRRGASASGDLERDRVKIAELEEKTAVLPLSGKAAD